MGHWWWPWLRILLSIRIIQCWCAYQVTAKLGRQTVVHIGESYTSSLQIDGFNVPWWHCHWQQGAHQNLSCLFHNLSFHWESTLWCQRMAFVGLCSGLELWALWSNDQFAHASAEEKSCNTHSFNKVMDVMMTGWEKVQAGLDYCLKQVLVNFGDRCFVVDLVCPLFFHRWWQARWSTLLPNQWSSWQKFIASPPFLWLSVQTIRWPWCHWVLDIPIDCYNQPSCISTRFARESLSAFNL